MGFSMTMPRLFPMAESFLRMAGSVLTTV